MFWIEKKSSQYNKSFSNELQQNKLLAANFFFTAVFLALDMVWNKAEGLVGEELLVLRIFNSK